MLYSNASSDWQRESKQSFLEKGPKNLHSLSRTRRKDPATASPKVFCFFFSKKKALLSSRSTRSKAIANSPLHLQAVTLAQGSRRVLSNATLSLGACEFVGLLGANGAGKTTLIRAALGLVPVARGEMRVLGARPVRGNPAIGYVPQLRSVPAGLRLSGRDFVAGAVRGHRWGLPILDAAGRRELDWALEMVGARDLACRPLLELSGGQRQRLLLAQALVGHPRLLLLDEPLMSLDPNHQRGVVELVRRVQCQLRITVVFSAHDLNPLLGHLDRVLYLGGGGAAIGTVDEVVTGPALSRLYGTAMDVVRLEGRIFVLPGHRNPGGDLPEIAPRRDAHAHA